MPALKKIESLRAKTNDARVKVASQFSDLTRESITDLCVDLKKIRKKAKKYIAKATTAEDYRMLLVVLYDIRNMYFELMLKIPEVDFHMITDYGKALNQQAQIFLEWNEKLSLSFNKELCCEFFESSFATLYTFMTDLIAPGLRASTIAKQRDGGSLFFRPTSDLPQSQEFPRDSVVSQVTEMIDWCINLSKTLDTIVGPPCDDSESFVESSDVLGSLGELHALTHYNKCLPTDLCNNIGLIIADLSDTTHGSGKIIGRSEKFTCMTKNITQLRKALRKRARVDSTIKAIRDQLKPLTKYTLNTRPTESGRYDPSGSSVMCVEAISHAETCKTKAELRDGKFIGFPLPSMVPRDTSLSTLKASLSKKLHSVNPESSVFVNCPEEIKVLIKTIIQTVFDVGFLALSKDTAFACLACKIRTQAGIVDQEEGDEEKRLFLLLKKASEPKAKKQKRSGSFSDSISDARSLGFLDSNVNHCNLIVGANPTPIVTLCRLMKKIWNCFIIDESQDLTPEMREAMVVAQMALWYFFDQVVVNAPDAAAGFRKENELRLKQRLQTTIDQSLGVINGCVALTTGQSSTHNPLFLNGVFNQLLTHIRNHLGKTKDVSSPMDAQHSLFDELPLSNGTPMDLADSEAFQAILGYSSDLEVEQEQEQEEEEEEELDQVQARDEKSKGACFPAHSSYHFDLGGDEGMDSYVQTIGI